MTVPVPETQPSEFITKRGCQDSNRLGIQLFIIAFPASIFAHGLLHIPEGAVAGILTPVWLLIRLGWANQQKMQRGEKVSKVQQKPCSLRVNMIRTGFVTALFVLIGLWCSVKLFPFLVHPLTHTRDVVRLIGAVYLEILIVSIVTTFIRLLRQTILQERTRLRAATTLVDPITVVSASPLEAPMTEQTATVPITRHWWTESQLRQEILTQGHNER